jgi:hypothetical protein
MTTQLSDVVPEQPIVSTPPRRWPPRRKPGPADLPAPDARFVGVLQLCALCGLCESAVYAAITRGELTRLKAGRRTLIEMSEVERWLRSRQGAAATSVPERSSASAERACSRCHGRTFWRTNAQPEWRCKVCRAPGRAARHGGYIETGSLPA